MKVKALFNSLVNLTRIKQRRWKEKIHTLDLRESCITSVEAGFIRGETIPDLEFQRLALRIDKSVFTLLSSHFDTHEMTQRKGFVVFAMKAPIALQQGQVVELLCISEKKLTILDDYLVQQSWYRPDIYEDLRMAQAICQRPDAVAVTVWEGSHNPIGRAKVLYDALKGHRPVVLFAFSFGDFGQDLWKPIIDQGLCVVLIPYEERQRYYAIFASLDLLFDTIWICKPRLHSFELAKKLSHPDTACVLDMDDNEELFASSEASKLKPFGRFTINKANFYRDRVMSRSVASISLQKEYGGEMVRHARNAFSMRDDESEKKGTKKKHYTAVFIGTIRPHKNVTTLVNSISAFNATSKIKVQLVVGGDFDPPRLADKLKKSGAKILGSISTDELFPELAKHDVVITGFPCETSESYAINRYQISAKIGDALATGRPALVPYSPAVVDLKKTPGVFLFTASSFGKQLRAALHYQGKIRLPQRFTLEYANEVFHQLERSAQATSLAKQVFLGSQLRKRQTSVCDKHYVVLLWKQQDSGVYGRRIDQIARYYRYRHPDSEVIVLDFVNEATLLRQAQHKHQHDKSFSTIHHSLVKKRFGSQQFGVDYQLLTYTTDRKTDPLSRKMTHFLASKNLSPSNTVFVAFPLIDPYKVLLPLLKGFPLLVDLVDNQLQWAKKPENRLKGMMQYLEWVSIADELVSNSEKNLQYFESLGLLGDKAQHWIRNWYSLPVGYEFRRRVQAHEIHVLYSGNLNDRIAWELFDQICKVVAVYSGVVHVVGTSIRSPEQMQQLLENDNCIYHGVMEEEQVLALLTSIDFAVIPHAEDDISKFMDPIKLRMYQVLSVRALTMALPGVEENEPWLQVASSDADFLARLNQLLEGCKREDYEDALRTKNDPIGDRYVELIDSLRLPHSLIKQGGVDE